jgi:hypothetical protein
VSFGLWWFESTRAHWTKAPQKRGFFVAQTRQARLLIATAQELVHVWLLLHDRFSRLGLLDDLLGGRHTLEDVFRWRAAHIRQGRWWGNCRFIGSFS